MSSESFARSGSRDVAIARAARISCRSTHRKSVGRPATVNVQDGLVNDMKTNHDSFRDALPDGISWQAIDQDHHAAISSALQPEPNTGRMRFTRSVRPAGTSKRTSPTIVRHAGETRFAGLRPSPIGVTGSIDDRCRRWSGPRGGAGGNGEGALSQALIIRPGAHSGLITGCVEVGVSLRNPSLAADRSKASCTNDH